MSRAEELLDSLTEEQIMMYGVNPVDEPHIVIESDRTITVPDDLRHISVQGEHNIETVTFDCPRYWDGHDLSQMQMRIVYQRPDGHREPHLVENLRVDEVDENTIHFEWTISGNVTAVKGDISFMVCAKLSDSEGNREREWHTRLNQDLIIDEGMDCSGDEIVEQNPDILEAILVQLDDLKNAGGVSDEQIANAIAAYLEEHPIESGVDEQQVRNIVAAYLQENPPEGGTVTEEQIETAVANYMSQHPIEAEPGGHYTPVVTQPTDNTMQVSFTPSKADMPPVESVTVNLPVGEGSGQNQPYTLPVATADALGGVKPTVAKGEGMTQPVAVDENGGMWTTPAASGTVLVAASDAPDVIKAAAQYVCTGINDQMTINTAIQAVGKGEVRLSGGNYYITAEITLIDDITLTGRNAIINVCDEISSTITQAYVGGDTVIHVADASVFVLGQKVSTDAGVNSKYECYIIGIDTEANTVTLDQNLHSASGFEADKYKLVADFTAVSCKYRENVIIDGLIVNGNGETYTRYDTVLGCNGIELYSSTNCKIINCTVRESRAHGIAVFVSTACTISNSLVEDCYELGIDLSNGQGGDGGHAIIGCTVSGAGNRGIQCHYAKRVNVVGCVLKNNSNGIGTQGSGQELIITGCNIYGNVNRGVYCSVSPGKNVVISDNIIAANGEGIQFDSVEDASITGNIIMENTTHGIKMIKSNRFVIANNKLMGNIPNDTKTEITTNAAIAITNACSHGLVIGNSITIDSTDSKGCACGIAENNMLGDCNVVVNNIIKGARVQATRKLGANSVFENNYEFD